MIVVVSASKALFATEEQQEPDAKEELQQPPEGGGGGGAPKNDKEQRRDVPGLKGLMNQLVLQNLKQVQKLFPLPKRRRQQQEEKHMHHALGPASHLQIKANENTFLQEKRLAYACFEDHECDALQRAHEDTISDDNDDRSSLSTSTYTNPFIGMKLQVYRQKQSIDVEDLSQGMNDDNDHLPISKNSKKTDVIQERLRYNSFVFEQAYRLIEPLHLELGVVPKHYLDFAYTPVMERRDESFLFQSPTTENNGDGKEWVSDKSSAHPLFPGEVGEDATKNVEEPICMAVPSKLHEEPTLPFNNWWEWWFPFTNTWWKANGSTHDDYKMGKTAFAGGSHGEVWRGHRICKPFDANCDDKQPLILKRLRIKRGYRLLEAGLREIYFGTWIRQYESSSSTAEDRTHHHGDDSSLFTVYVDHFFREVPRAFGKRSRHSNYNINKDLELWIVFEDAGKSLRNYLYTPMTVNDGFVMYQHSPLWAQMRMINRDIETMHKDYKEDREEDMSAMIATSYKKDGDETIYAKDFEDGDHPRNKKMPNVGREILRSVLRQVLAAAASLHEHGTVHRDIKPSNIMCNSNVPLDDLYALKEIPKIRCRLGDFSSAWDKYAGDNLYTNGPSPAEQTDEYAPPESYIGPGWVPFYEAKPHSYDSWSIGVLALELLLGTPNVFSVDQRTTALLTNKMKKEGATDEELQRALYLAALSHFCIYVPTINSTKQQSWPLRHGDPLHNTAMVTESCTLQDFHRALRARDPLGLGFDSSTDLLLHLIWQLLTWDPVERMTAAEALDHPYFDDDQQQEKLKMLPDLHEENNVDGRNTQSSSSFIMDEGYNEHFFSHFEDTGVNEFICPKCGRIYSDWESCHRHANSRRHAKFCHYDRRNLPTCINTHSMLPAHPTSGYCDLQGRRRTIEDFHSINLHPSVQFYGIFDGHTGNLASKYVAATLYDYLISWLPDLTTTTEGDASSTEWKVHVQQNVSQAFREIHEGFLEAVASQSSSRARMDQSGTTATTLLVTERVIVVSSLGDSRAVLSSTSSSKNEGQLSLSTSLSAIQLTKDHVASDPEERAMVLKRGGVVSSGGKDGRLPRVNGTLAITRSIGDARLAPILSRQPHVLALTRTELKEQCRGGGAAGSTQSPVPCFVVLASDGLWDVMSNQEAVDRVASVIESYDATDGVSWNNGGAFQEAAEVLAIDAYVRGSTDNIGVCVVAVE